MPSPTRFSVTQSKMVNVRSGPPTAGPESGFDPPELNMRAACGPPSFLSALAVRQQSLNHFVPTISHSHRVGRHYRSIPPRFPGGLLRMGGAAALALQTLALGKGWSDYRWKSGFGKGDLLGRPFFLATD